MGEKPAQIEREIEIRRERIGRNIRDLQHQVSDMADWRKQFERRSGVFMGIAFGAGLFLSLALGNGHHQGPSRGASERGSASTNLARQTLENIKSALVGVAAAKFTEMLAEAIPGFRDEYGKTEGKASVTYAL